MTEAETARKTPVLKIRSKSRSVDEFVARYCMDFSRAGMFVKTKRPFEPGIEMRFEFQLIDGTGVFEGRGTVAWKREDRDDAVRPAGMGVAFDTLAENGAALVERLVRSRGGRRSRFEDRGSTPPAAVDAAAALDAPVGLFSSLAEEPLQVGSSPPSALATRLKSAPPGEIAPVVAPSGPPVEPDVYRAADPDDEPMIEDPEAALGAKLVDEDVSARERASEAAIGQLQGVLAQAFQETVRRTSIPPKVGSKEIDLGDIDPDAVALTASASTRPHGDFDSNWPEPAREPAPTPKRDHGPYTGRETALSNPYRQERLHSLVDKAKFDEPPKNFRALTWNLMTVLAGLIVLAGIVRYVGPERVSAWLNAFTDLVRPYLQDLGLVE